MGGTLDDALHARLTAVVRSREPTTEAELRELAEQGAAWELVLRGRLEHREAELELLSGDPASSLTAVALGVREARALQAELDELRELLGELDARARGLRATWLA